MAGRPKSTHCKHGHELVPGNVYCWTNPKGYVLRQCLQCRRLKDRERYVDKPQRRETMVAAHYAREARRAEARL